MVNLNTKCLSLYFTCSAVHILPDVHVHCHITVILYLFTLILSLFGFFFPKQLMCESLSMLAIFFPVC